MIGQKMDFFIKQDNLFEKIKKSERFGEFPFLPTLSRLTFITNSPHLVFLKPIVALGLFRL